MGLIECVSPKRFRKMPPDLRVTYNSIVLGTAIGVGGACLLVFFHNIHLSFLLAAPLTFGFVFISLHLLLETVDRIWAME